MLNEKIQKYLSINGKRAVNLIDYKLRDDGGGAYIKEWNETLIGIKEPTSETLDLINDTDIIKDRKILEINSQAYIRITTFYPEYKQLNFNGAVSTIQNKEIIALKSGAENYTTTSDEMILLRAARTCKDFIDKIRTKSNQLVESLDSMTEEQLNAFDPSEDSNWE